MGHMIERWSILINRQFGGCNYVNAAGLGGYCVVDSDPDRLVGYSSVRAVFCLSYFSSYYPKPPNLYWEFLSGYFFGIALVLG